MGANTDSVPSVLQVNKLYPPHIGGVEAAVKSISEGLAERGFDVNVLAATVRGCGSTNRQNGVTVRRTPSLGTLMSVPVGPSFPFHYRQASKRATVVHHHLPNPLGVLAHFLFPPADAVTVATYHSDIVRQAAALRFYRPLLRRFLERVDRIFVTSPRLVEHSQHLAPFESKCEVVPLSIDIDAMNRGKETDIDLPGEQGRRVLFVGRLNYYKGVEYLIDAMSHVDGTLLVVGDGQRRPELERRVYKLELSDHVAFLGAVADEVLDACYDAADVFVLPSVEPSEAFGIVQLEAMARGIPVVNTALPTGVPWVSQDGETGLTVRPEDSSALAAAITSLLDDDTRRTDLGNGAKHRVETKFIREDMLDSLEKSYSELLAE